MGDGEHISISIGVPAAGPVNMVWARANGVRALFFRTCDDVSGESTESSVMSVVEGNSPSALPQPIDECG